MSKLSNSLTLSIIIPVYNEENYLAACLQSIAVQTVRPLEVIVIDNNSGDGSMEIASSFPFVRIISETRRHQSYAQATGFDSARGDLLGRIDADTILPPTWTETVIKSFEAKQKTVAVTGSGLPYDTFAQKTVKFLFDKYYHLADTFSGHTMLWGANCALRRSAWLKVRDKVLLRADIWEDYDLSFCLASLGRIEFLPRNEVLVSFRAAHKPLITQTRYQFRAVRTFAIRKGRLRATAFMLCWSSLFAMYVLLLLDKYVFRAISAWGQTPKTDTTGSSRS